MATIYLSSTYEDLRDYREAACRALRRLGHQVVAMEDYVARDDRPLDACLADVARCDLYVGIIGWRYGHVPNQDNPERRSITEREYRKAVDLHKPRLLFLVAEDAPWPPRFVDKGDPAGALKSLRDELGNGRLASFFRTEHELGELVSAAVVQWERRASPNAPAQAPFALPSRLRTYHDPELPPTPYPLLQPYEHPATFGGRDRELDDLARLVRAPQLVLCLHAPSGAGKSSLLLAGLAARLRAQGRPVSLDRHPAEPGLARRIVADLFELPPEFELADDDLAGFARCIAQAARLAGRPPALIVDQLGDALRLPDGGDEALSRLGPLMAATAQRLPGEQGYTCRWVLCYRHEFHGIVNTWLDDVLLQARARNRSGLETLPWALSGADRFHRWEVPVMGAPPPGGTTGAEHIAARFSRPSKNR